MAQRTSLKVLLATALAGFGISTIAFGFVPASLPAIVMVGGVCGFFLFGAGTGAYATLATTFDDTARASGTGFAIGVGRIASATGPTLAGGMFTLGLSQGAVSVIFGVLNIFAAAILFLGWRRFRL